MIDFQAFKAQSVIQNLEDLTSSDDLTSLLDLAADTSSNSLEALDALKKIAGEKRLERIFKRQGKEADWKALNAGTLPISQETMHEILIGMADVCFEDIQEKGGDGATTEKLDRLYHSLLPKKNIKDFFHELHHEVKYYDRFRVTGKKIAAVEERVWTILQHKELLASGSNNAEFGDLEMLSSRLGDREPPIGTVVRLSTGYFTAEKIFAGGGAYVTLWRSVSKDLPPILLCRGTASFGATEGVMSKVSDILPELGLYGIQSIWLQLKEYLEENEIRFVDIFGKSLGGAHAQYLTTLITGLTRTCVSNLKTTCSVGTPHVVSDIFNDALKNSKKAVPFIDVYRNIGDYSKGHMDYVPCIGGQHLHALENTRYIYVIPEKDLQQDSIEAFHCPKSFLSKFAGFIWSFDKGHTRQNSLKAYSLVESKNTDLELSVGSQLEPWRSKLATLFNACTFHTFQLETFEEFYSSLKTRAHA